MGLKAGWLALVVFVWLVGAFLGSTFEYQSADASAGMAYAIGTANFTTGSANVTGAGTSWNHALMSGGLIKCNADGVWYKIASVNSTTLLTMTAVYAQVGGAGMAYTMQASPGWAGAGGGGYATSPVSKLNYLMNISNAVHRISLLGVIPFVVHNGEYFKAAFQMLTWQWSFLYNPDGTMAYGLFYYIFCMPFVVMAVLCLILLVYGILTGNLTF